MIVNGKEYSLESTGAKSIEDLIRFFQLDPQAVAVEKNGEIPDRATWKSSILTEQDRIELIKFVGGG